MAPIDPDQLIAALDPLLTRDGGIKSAGETTKVCSLVEKFSKKLVSRTIYLNVLESTEADILEAFLKGGGWKTLNLWLQEACTLKNNPFVSQLMTMFNKLPMTLDRLKQNNTPKLIKSLSKNTDESIKNLAQEIVEKWMKIIQIDTHKKKKRDSTDEGPPKKLKKIKTKEESNGKRNSFSEDDDDRNFKENNHLVVTSPTKKTPKPERPKTVKTFHSKFRSTGLEQAVPLPKEIVKKSTTADKSSLIIKSATTKKTLPPPISSLDKKLKLDQLINHSAEKASLLQGGIKLIPPKPKPTIHESNIFMQSLDKASTPVLRRKKKLPIAKPTTPPPAVIPPKLEFYKDTMMDTSDVKPEVKETEQNSPIKTEPLEEVKVREEEEQMEVDQIEPEEPVPLQPGEIRSILTIIKKVSRKKKKIHWKEEQDLVKIRYFDLEENERVNVNKIKGDIKLIEMKQERQTLEITRRVKGDKMEESIPWRMPTLLTLPPSMAEPGCNSDQKKILKDRVALQALYFSKETIPDSAHEPDPSELLFTSEAPKIIPLEDTTNPTPITDYSDMNPELTKLPITPPPILGGILPPVLTSLFNRNLLGGVLENPIIPAPMPTLGPIDTNRPPILLDAPPMGHPPQFDRVQPQQFKAGFLDTEIGGTWLPIDSKPPVMQQPEEFGFNHPPNMQVPGQLPPHQMQFRGNPGGHMMNNINNNCRDGPRPQWNQQPMRNNHRMRGPPRVACKHFAMGTCRFGNKCTFLHPGINGPPL